MVYETIHSAHFLSSLPDLGWRPLSSPLQRKKGPRTSSTLVRHSQAEWWWSVCWHWAKGLCAVIAMSAIRGEREREKERERERERERESERERERERER